MPPEGMEWEIMQIIVIYVIAIYYLAGRTRINEFVLARILGTHIPRFKGGNGKHKHEIIFTLRDWDHAGK